MKKLVSFASAAAVVLSMAGPAAAADTVEAHFSKGVELYAEADFRSAVVEFRRAYEMSKNYKILYNLAQCEYQLTNYVAALEFFEKYLADGGTTVPADRRKEIESELPKIRGRVANVTVKSNVSGASVTLDDKEVGQTPLLSPVLLNPGVHRLGAKKAGYTDFSRVVEVAGGDTTSAEINLVEAPAGQANQGGQPATESKNWTPAIVAWSAAGVFAVTGLVLGLSASSKSDDLSELKGRPNVTAAQLEDADSSTKTMALLTDIAFGAAIVSAGVATYFTVSGGKSSTAAKTRISPTIGGLSCSGTF